MFKPQISKRGKHYFAEVALARGPREMAVTGTGSFVELFGYAWMALLDRGEHRLRLFQVRDAGGPWAIGTPSSGPEWVEVPVPELPHDTTKLRHLGLAFDQAARHVVTYERAGEIWVRQWDAVLGQYAMRGPFSGVDPVLIMDATASAYVPDADVLLFHMNTDRTRIIMRAQRELFGDAHMVHTVSGGAYLDQAIALPYQIELVGSLVDEPDATGLVLRSDMYPVRGREAIGATELSGPGGGIYWPVVVVHNIDADSIGVVSLSAPVGGTYLPLVIERSLNIDTIGSAEIKTPSTGIYHPVVVTVDIAKNIIGGAGLSSPSGGAYALVVVIADMTQQPYHIDNGGSALLAAPLGGSYVNS